MRGEGEGEEGEGCRGRRVLEGKYLEGEGENA